MKIGSNDLIFWGWIVSGISMIIGNLFEFDTVYLIWFSMVIITFFIYGIYNVYKSNKLNKTSSKPYTK